MSGFSKTMLVVLALAASISLAEAGSLGKPDLTKRQAQIGDKRMPYRTLDLQKDNAINGKLIPIKEWHAEFSPLGQRRASIDVREGSAKKMIRPEVIEMRKIDRKMAPQSRRMAYLRNFDQVQEKQGVAKYRDAEVGRVQEMVGPAPSRKTRDKPMTMRDINRFSFQRNHPDTGGPKVDRAASGEKE